MNRLGRSAVLLAAGLAMSSCGRKPAATPPRKSPPPSTYSASPGAPQPAKAPHFAVTPLSRREGMATWYQVPTGSLPERRAWAAEFTAASDALPLGRYARVTRLSSGKSIIARVTDKGIHRRHTLIDVCKEAADALGMVENGEVRVRVEELALENADAEKPVTGREDAVKKPVVGATQQNEEQAAAAKAPPAP